MQKASNCNTNRGKSRNKGCFIVLQSLFCVPLHKSVKYHNVTFSATQLAFCNIAFTSFAGTHLGASESSCSVHWRTHQGASLQLPVLISCMTPAPLIQRKHPFLSILFTVLDKKRTFLSNTVVLLNKNHGLHVKHDRTSFHARTIL